MTTKAQKTAAEIGKAVKRAQDVLALRAGQYPKGEDMQDYWPVDLIVDLRHLCDKYGFDWDEALESADGHYRAEIAGEDQFDDEEV